MKTLLALLLLVASEASAQMYEMTLFAGGQGGGVIELEDEDTGLQTSPAFGFMVSFDRGRGRKLDLVLSHQGTKAEREDPFEPPVSADVSIQYFHIGGRYFWDPERRVAPYVAATAGGTYLRVRNAEGAFLSFAIGAGAEIALNEKTAIRFDGRFYTSLIGASLEISCTESGQACAGVAEGAQFFQFAATTAIVIKF